MINNSIGQCSATSDVGGYKPLLTPSDALLNSKPWPEVITAFDLCSKPPELPPELIRGVLYAGGTMIVSGPSKARKTFTLLDAGISIAAGVPWLGMATERTNVLYLNLELQEFALARRLVRIAEAKKVTFPLNLHIINLRERVTSMVDIARELPGKLSSLDIGAVIIDPLYKVSAYSGADENSNNQQATFLGQIQEICAESRSAILFAHHFAKGSAANKNQIDRASGSGVFARWPDVVMTLTEHKEPGAMTMEFSLRNFSALESFVVRWDGAVWKIDGALNPDSLKRAGAGPIYTTDRALKALSYEGMTFSSWLAAVGCSESTFRRRRDELLNVSHQVIQRGDKYYPAAPAQEVPASGREVVKISFRRPVGWNSQNRQNDSSAVVAANAAPTIQPPPVLTGGGGRQSGDGEVKEAPYPEAEVGVVVSSESRTG